MKPALAFPFNDPDGMMFYHLQAILPDLKKHFGRAYICPSFSTLQSANHLQQLQTDDFFTIFHMERDMQIGELFAHLYQRTGETAHPDQIIHLCFLDRLAFALEGNYRDSFLADIDSLSVNNVPLIFQRSPLAWETHPQNYRDIEGIITTVGRHLFGRELDYAWCHIVVRAGQLREIMPRVENLGLSMVAEMIYYLQPHIQTREVDWLAWEDPFFLQRDTVELKCERENSLAETHKRLSYALPMTEMLTKLSQVELKNNAIKVNQ
jgi:hypothetical protein